MSHGRILVLVLLAAFAVSAVASGQPARRPAQATEPTQVPDCVRWTPPMPEA